MPAGWAAAAVGLVGAVAGADSSRKAAHTQADAAAASNALQKDQYGQTADRNQPFVSGGTTAFNALVSRLGKSSIPSASDVTSTPGYQFGMDQGQNQLNRQLNARGMNYSGAQLKAASRYGTDYATTKYDDAFNRSQQADQQSYNQAFGLARMGQASANNTAASGENFANTTSNNLQGAANANAAAGMASTNGYVGALNQGVSAYKNMPSGGGSSSGGSSGEGMPSSYDTSTGGSYHAADNYGDAVGGWASGGPVVEPVVGSRTPLPGGSTGGGMSKAQIIAALMQPPPPQRTGIGALPANPVTHPQAILQNQLQQAGAYRGGGEVDGDGTATSDSIPARLSNGEHVIDAAAVTGLGNGSNARGQNKLNALRRKWKN